MPVTTKVKPAVKAKAPEMTPSTQTVLKIEGMAFTKDTLLSAATAYDRLKKANKEQKSADADFKAKAAPILAEVKDNGVPETGYSFDAFGRLTKITKAADQCTVVSPMKDVAKLLEAVKPGLFYELAKITLTDLRAYLTPEQLAEITTTTATGSRSLSFE